MNDPLPGDFDLKWREYQRQLQTHEAAMHAWRMGGALGPQPPLPVAPVRPIHVPPHSEK